MADIVSDLGVNLLEEEIDNDSKAYRLVEFVMDVARFLGVKVIAEGVEYLEQYEILKKLGCDVIQGYYFSKPVCAEEFERFIKE
ncbi:MAG: EAL domain-containing protein [Lachnospiraceae bacterium]|nr:EAL domain-containing protein [Lachnospiraceae bacterium]